MASASMAELAGVEVDYPRGKALGPFDFALAGGEIVALVGPSGAGKVIGPSFSSHEVPDVIEAVLDTYRQLRQPGERFIDTVRRVGHDPFKAAGQQARHATDDEADDEPEAATAA